MMSTTAGEAARGGARPMHVVVASDGSEGAAVVIDLVAGIGWPAGSTIEIVGAWESSALRFGGAWPTDLGMDSVRLDEEMRLLLEQELANERDRLARPDVTGEVVVEVGRPADVILERAEQAGADLIVIGSRGHGRLQAMLLGSVSAEVIDHAVAPVLVARGHGIDRIVLAWDGSSGAQHAAQVLTAWPIFGASEVRVISVADDAASVRPWAADPVAWEAATHAYAEVAEPSGVHHDELARDMAERLRDAGIRAEPERRNGDPAAELVAAATAWDANLIVMGTRGQTGLRRLVLGSVARNVLHHAPCSVLVVREPRIESQAAA